MSETCRPLAIILFCRSSNYVQNAVEKSNIGPVVFELQSAPYCKMAFLKISQLKCIMYNTLLVTFRVINRIISFENPSLSILGPWREDLEV